ncbi:helix-turn-helix transcriptional regulator [Defluviimonas aestuarii]|uniref:helix-turn-helix domain-containing protein n=1 Tax=Albidovulum aestuarii TaxID=1130726 RepID=UPI00249C1802|nr:helix-turn-helix transcriptional regulator [Defluviimonas aestuarii]MDI3336456.1 helix-turn-helix transcriptional regulator [Defluviimonas aestuarii]
MAETASLFARKLRDWRTGAGLHGRMTQEELAERLGVSVDAIGKYERSQSFIRGDLEHRLSDALGWSREEVLECREDWDSRRGTPERTAYRLLDDNVVQSIYGGSWRRASHESIVLAIEEFGALPEELAANDRVFGPIYETYHEHWAVVMHGDRMVAKWALPFLNAEDEALFRAGRLLEADLSIERIRRPILPGTYFGYSPAVVVRPGHESASMLLLSSFVDFLEALADRDVFLHGIGSISVSPGGAQICQDLGMTWLGTHCLDPSYGLWELPGAAVAGSIIARRSPKLRLRYNEVFGT